MFAARHPGLTSSSAAALLVEEALRMDAHPGVVFRDGPSGRRAVVVSGPDVWEVIKAVRDTRGSEPTLAPDEITDLVSSNAGLDSGLISVAIDYYSHFPAEIDAQVNAADEVESQVERALGMTRQLFGS
jgi:hypothetical protein